MARARALGLRRNERFLRALLLRLRLLQRLLLARQGLLLLNQPLLCLFVRAPLGLGLGFGLGIGFGVGLCVGERKRTQRRSFFSHERLRHSSQEGEFACVWFGR